MADFASERETANLKRIINRTRVLIDDLLHPDTLLEYIGNHFDVFKETIMKRFNLLMAKGYELKALYEVNDEEDGGNSNSSYNQS